MKKEKTTLCLIVLLTLLSSFGLLDKIDAADSTHIKLIPRVVANTQQCYGYIGTLNDKDNVTDTINWPCSHKDAHFQNNTEVCPEGYVANGTATWVKTWDRDPYRCYNKCVRIYQPQNNCQWRSVQVIRNSG